METGSVLLQMQTSSTMISLRLDVSAEYKEKSPFWEISEEERSDYAQIRVAFNVLSTLLRTTSSKWENGTFKWFLRRLQNGTLKHAANKA